MPYPIVSHDLARTWWNEWREAEDNDSPPSPPVVDTALYGADHPWADKLVPSLISELNKLYDKVEDPASNFASDSFEAEACVLVHNMLPDDEALADPEFWIWIATNLGIDFIRRRYKPEKNKPIPGMANFTSPSARETAFYRFWIRAELAFDDMLDDPYELARYGDIDFWRSHIFRQTSSESRKMLAAFARFQYPDGPDGQKRLKTKEIRELIKYMKRAAANMIVEAFDDEEAERFISDQWEKVQRLDAMKSAAD